MNIFILSFRLPVCNTEYSFICACYLLFTSAFIYNIVYSINERRLYGKKIYLYIIQ